MRCTAIFQGYVALLAACFIQGLFAAESALLSSPLRERSADTNSVKSGAKLRIVYVIRSFPGHYETVLKDQFSTWMKHLDPHHDRVLVASLAANHVPVPWATFDYSTPTWCKDNHGEGLCCQEAHAIVKLGRHYDFDWAVFIDDDVYVWPPVMREVVEDASANPRAAVGVPGCGVQKFGGFCGGGGYLISREVIVQMATDPSFMELYEGNCKLTQFCDITTSWLLKTHYNASLVSDPKTRLHSWGLATGQDKPDAEHHDQVYADLTAKLVDFLRHHSIASLHYRGGQVTDDFDTKHSRMLFLHRIFTTVYLSGI